MKKKVFIEISAFFLAVTVLLSITYYLGYKLMPLRENYGATWNMYEKEQENSVDILFVGSSMAYCDIIPAKIYEKTGLTSYVMGAPNMNAGVAYYYLKEALRTQDPKLVMVEATSFCFSELSAEDSKINIGYMPWSLNRLEATFTVAHPDERLGLLFPLYNYHTRFSDYSLNAIFSPRGDSKTDIWAGYTYLDKAVVQSDVTPRKYDIDNELLNENMDYLKKIIDLCKDENIKLELFMVPSCEYVPSDLTETIKKHANGTVLTKFNDSFDETGLDLNTDFYDSLHLNFKGAEIFSSVLADHISENYSIAPASHDKLLWKERLDHYTTKTKEFVLKES